MYKFYIFLFIALMGCTDPTDKVHVPDTEEVVIPEVKFVRYDKLIQSLDTLDIERSYEELHSKYPFFTDLYFNRILEIDSTDKEDFYKKINAFLNAESIKKLNDTIDFYFPNMNLLESDLEKALKIFKYYFDDFIPPNYYTLQSEFGFQTFIFNDGKKDGIGIGLDLFLGEGFNYKNIDPTNPSFSDYLTRSYNQDHIVKKAIELSVNEIVGNVTGRRFIDHIIKGGKQLYLLQHILPETHDSIIMELSDSQLKWCKDNEFEIWSFFLDQELIYQTDHLKINKYISSSPHSPGMPQEAPGNTGQFIGWQIVKAYMERNPEKSLIDLVKMKDSQKLMELSKYRPKRR